MKKQVSSALWFFMSVRDRANTAVNVLGDCIGVALVDQLSRKELEEMDEPGEDITG